MFAIGSIEVCCAFTSKLEMLSLVMTNRDMRGSRGIMIRTIRLTTKKVRGRVTYERGCRRLGERDMRRGRA